MSHYVKKHRELKRKRSLSPLIVYINNSMYPANAQVAKSDRKVRSTSLLKNEAKEKEYLHVHPFANTRKDPKSYINLISKDLKIEPPQQLSSSDSSDTDEELPKLSSTLSIGRPKEKITQVDSSPNSDNKRDLSPVRKSFSIESSSSRMRTLTVPLERLEPSTLRTVNFTISDVEKIVNTAVERAKEEIVARIEKTMEKLVDSSKRSLQYDLRESIGGLSNNLVLNHGKVLDMTKIPDIEVLGMTMPTQSVEDFMKFEELLRIDEGKLELVKKLIFLKISSVASDKWRSGCNAALATFMGLKVQLCYTGKGKYDKDDKENPTRIKKKSLKDTLLYKTVEGIIFNHFNIEPTRILNQASVWLTGAGDRGGGRKKRAMKVAARSEVSKTHSDEGKDDLFKGTL